MKITVKENVIDKALRYISPERAMRRMRARASMAMADAWHGGSKSRRSVKEWSFLKGDPDSVHSNELPVLRERSVDLFRNANLATGALRTNRTAVIGAGLILQSRIDRKFLGMSNEAADEWEANTEREFRLHFDSQECDIERNRDFGELQRQALMAMFLKGDVFVNLPMLSRPGSPYKLKVQLIDGERVTNKTAMGNTPTLVEGVEKDGFGAPVAYWVANHYPFETTIKKEKTWTRLKAFGAKTGRRNVLHICENEQLDQTRGIPYLAPVIESLRGLGQYTESEIQAAVISSYFTVFIKSETGEFMNPMEPTSETGATTTDDELKLGSGAVAALAPGEDIEIANPNRPNTAFDDFIKAGARQIGAALELPFEFVIKHFTASYSASRASILEAWRVFRARRTWFTNKFCKPIYEAWMEEAVASGRIKAPGFFRDPLIRQAYLRSEWIGPSRGQIDESKEMQAVEKQIQLGVTTHAKATAEINGSDWDTNMERLKLERQIKSESGGLPEEQPEPGETEEPMNPDELDLEEEQDEIN